MTGEWTEAFTISALLKRGDENSCIKLSPF